MSDPYIPSFSWHPNDNEPEQRSADAHEQHDGAHAEQRPLATEAREQGGHQGRHCEHPEATPAEGDAVGEGALLLEVLTHDNHGRGEAQRRSDPCNERATNRVIMIMTTTIIAKQQKQLP